ncbi:MAG TPA: hypothetical protein VFE05_03305 [Longimicrobiaceae bacterium]|jgi:hypothetical protein|nr:hypothetical protein [Longimicrobiaceae bacterium]
MPFMFVDRHGRGTFPEEVCRDLGLDGSADANTLILAKTPNGTYEMFPATAVPEDQHWFYHPEMQDRMAAAEDDFRAGRYEQTNGPDAAQAYLDRLKKSR